MKKLLGVLAILFLSDVSVYAGNTRLLQSNPANDSVSTTPPSAFVFEFSEPVRLNELSLGKEGEKSKSLSNLPDKDAKEITVPAPVLTSGRYVLMWKVFTHESRALSGRIRFTISAQPAATPH